MVTLPNTCNFRSIFATFLTGIKNYLRNFIKYIIRLNSIFKLKKFKKTFFNSLEVKMREIRYEFPKYGICQYEFCLRGEGQKYGITPPNTVYLVTLDK